MSVDWDVIVVGAGNAAFCAALAASERGASVLVLERAPESESGGNSRFTAGAIRFAYDGVDDIRALCPDLTDEQCAMTDFGCYSVEQFFDDMFRVTHYRTDGALMRGFGFGLACGDVVASGFGGSVFADLWTPSL